MEYNMQKLQIMLEDSMAKKIKDTADELGLSVSSYTRLLISKSFKREKHPLEIALKEKGEEISLSDFKTELREMKLNA